MLLLLYFPALSLWCDWNVRFVPCVLHVQHLPSCVAALAILHNDDAVLERFHVSSAYMVAQKPGREVFKWLSPEAQRRVRSLVINMVLATVRDGPCGSLTPPRPLLQHPPTAAC